MRCVCKESKSDQCYVDYSHSLATPCLMDHTHNATKGSEASVVAILWVSIEQGVVELGRKDSLGGLYKRSVFMSVATGNPKPPSGILPAVPAGPVPLAALGLP